LKRYIALGLCQPEDQMQSEQSFSSIATLVATLLELRFERRDSYQWNGTYYLAESMDGAVAKLAANYSPTSNEWLETAAQDCRYILYLDAFPPDVSLEKILTVKGGRLIRDHLL
jgi:hypothetical protein